MGWKDTVRAHAGLITRIIVRFEGYPGRYVWHCHVLEHSANEMMRPYEVVARTVSKPVAALVPGSARATSVHQGDGLQAAVNMA
jgi:hypothetical protein